MSEPVRFLLLSDSIKEQLKTHSLKVIEAWSSRWGLFEGCSWDVSISSALDGVDLKRIDMGAKRNDELFFCLSCFQSKYLLNNEIARKKTVSMNSKLLDSITNKALHDFQRDFVLGQLLKEGEAFNSKEFESKLPEYFKENNMVAVNLSVGKFQMVLLLSMPLLNILVEESEVDHRQQVHTLENPIRSIDDEFVCLDVEYGSVDISVEELSTIRTGDVICLEKPISSPMSISDKSGNHLFSGYLSVKKEKLALKVTAKN